MFRSKILIASLILMMLASACASTATQTISTPPVSTEAATAVATETPSTPEATEALTPAATEAPSATQVLPSTGGVDWTQNGFATVLATQEISATAAITITAAPYSIQAPAGAFSGQVTFELLQGDPAMYQDKVPSGETPLLAFALQVKDAQGQMVEKFNQPVMLTVQDPQISAGSHYYNLGPDGTLTDNPTGLQATPGMLSHPIAGAGVAWVITSPAASPTSAAMGATVQTVNNATLGTILVNSDGYTLYTFKNDQPGVSNCTGNCAAAWPPLTVQQGEQPAAGQGVSGQLGTIQRADGSLQVTYNGMPLYLYTKDTKPGDTNGQGIGNVWYVVPVQ